MKRIWIAALALALIATACATDNESESAGTSTTQVPTTMPSTTDAPTTTQAPTASGGTLAVSASALGDVITDGDGNTLYLFVPDAQGESTCYDGCEAAWPPLVGEVSAGDGVDPALIGSTERTDGTQQATYNDWPLYYFASDAAAGDTNGQGINEVWYVVDASGVAVGLSASAAIALTDSDLGPILTDGDGNTLYLFVPDAQGESTCYDGCEAAWPPLVGEVSAGDGVDPALIGSTERTDGTRQATYNDWPLYYFASDAAAGDTNGQGINEVWYVVDADGNAVE